VHSNPWHHAGAHLAGEFQLAAFVVTPCLDETIVSAVPCREELKNVSLLGHSRLRATSDDDPESACCWPRVSGKYIITLHDLETRFTQFRLDDVRSNLVVFHLLFSRCGKETVANAFADDEQATWFQWRHHSRENGAMFGHFVIRVPDQHCVKLPNGQFRISRLAMNYFNVCYSVLFGPLAKLVEGLGVKEGRYIFPGRRARTWR